MAATDTALRLGGNGSKQTRKTDRTLPEYVLPPYPLKELVAYAENSAWHAACVEAVAQNVIGYKIGIRKSARLPEDVEPDERQREIALRFLETASPDAPLEEMIKSVVRDFKNTGTGTIEVARNAATRLPEKLFYMPTATTLVHRTLPKVRQQDRSGVAYFWLFGAPDRPPELNEVLRIFRPNHRSAYYGIPDHLAAVQAIVGDILARNYNFARFGRRMLADWACVFEGAPLTDNVKEAIKRHFQELADDDDVFTPLFLESPAPGSKVTWQRLNDEIKDASWTIYRKLSRDEILAVHRVPPRQNRRF